MEGDNGKKRERRKRSDHVLVNYAAVGTVRREKKRKNWYSGMGRGVRSSECDCCVYSNSSFVFLYMDGRRVKAFYSLVVTSLEGLQWWSPIIAECTEQP